MRGCLGSVLLQSNVAGSACIFSCQGSLAVSPASVRLRVLLGPVFSCTKAELHPHTARCDQIGANVKKYLPCACSMQNAGCHPTCTCMLHSTSIKHKHDVQNIAVHARRTQRSVTQTSGENTA